MGSHAQPVKRKREDMLPKRRLPVTIAEQSWSSFLLAELMDPLNRRMMPIKESHLEQSALSAALGSPNSKQSSE